MSEQTELETQFDKQAREGHGAEAQAALNEILRLSAPSTIDSQIDLLRQKAQVINDGDYSLPQVNVVSGHPHDNEGKEDISQTRIQVQVRQDKAHFPQIIVDETMKDSSRELIGTPEVHDAKFKN